MTDVDAEGARATVLQSIREGGQPSRIYWLMNGLAAVIAAYGLLANSSAVVIGAMVVAMLLGPIAGISLGLTDRDRPLLFRSTLALSGGFIWVLLIGLIIGFIHRSAPITNEIVARTSPTLFDLMVALAGGAAAGIALVNPRIGTAIVGVAIATALVPPITASGLLLARGELAMAGGALTMALTNVVAIQLAFGTVLWVNGYRKVSSPTSAGILEFLRRDALDIAVVLGLAVFLTINLSNTVAKALFETRTRGVLASGLEGVDGAHLAEVRFDRTKQTMLVRAVVRGPRPPTIAQIGAMQAKLPDPPRADRAKRVELRVRFVQTQILTAHGVLSFEDESPGESPD